MTDNNLKYAITGDETWIYAYYSNAALQSGEYPAAGDLRPTKKISRHVKNQDHVNCFLRL